MKHAKNPNNQAVNCLILIVSLIALNIFCYICITIMKLVLKTNKNWWIIF